ncbi:MAG TPA: PAS domain-containing protein [Phycisphaerae bacterium]|nr:PAS domain-containing protein [Phycisphaerae bacterium]HRY68130.1 PAS domain-containing protein [Phycisphaerae bacterium]HSA28787.1 PAS domain-containing protein [Phycisphaerae bacterium]
MHRACVLDFSLTITLAGTILFMVAGPSRANQGGVDSSRPDRVDSLPPASTLTSSGDAGSEQEWARVPAGAAGEAAQEGGRSPGERARLWQASAVFLVVVAGLSVWIQRLSREIRRRKALETASTMSEALLRIAGRTARLGGWSVTIADQRVDWSDEVALIHETECGYSPSLEEAIGFYAPEWRERIAKVFGDCARDGTPYDEELELITARGNRVWVRTTGEAVRDKSGAIVGVQGAFQDITDRKRTEGRLQAQLLELQRWHGVTLGRERRIQELKDEVNALLGRLGEPARYREPEPRGDAAVTVGQGSGRLVPVGGATFPGMPGLVEEVGGDLHRQDGSGS